MNKLVMIDLCAWTGAFSHVFNEYGVKCVFANDYNDDSEKIFNLNHDIKLTNTDLNKYKISKIPKHDILCQGFSCQPYSIAGKLKGLEDERSEVFFTAIKILKKHKPKFAIFENVKNLVSHDNGKTFKIVLKAIKKLKYHVKYKILNTTMTGIPHNRERVYIVCFKYKKHHDLFDFNFNACQLNDINDYLEDDVDNKYYYSNRFKVYDTVKEGVTRHIDTNTVYQYQRRYVRENKKSVVPCLTANTGKGGHNVPLLKDDNGIRKLTPRECFNLQGFPNDYELPDISDSRLYQLAGNAVTVNVVELIVNKLDNIIV